jgi:plastocyanin
LTRFIARVTSAAALLIVFGSAAHAQSLLDRPPNLGGNWVGNPGQLHFNFLHRFAAGDAPQRKVSNGPTFLLGYSLPARLLIGTRYATNSQVVPGLPNEWEFFGRYNPISEVRGAPLDATLHAGYNQTAESFDAELTLSKRVGPLNLLGVARMLSSAFGRDTLHTVLGAGATLRITSNVALAADYATLLDRAEDEDAVWGAGVHVRIPYSPHTLSFQVTNTNSGTLQGSSIGTGDTRYGFEFTIPITLARYVRRPVAPAPPATDAPAVGGPGQTIRMAIRALAYETPLLIVRPGTTIVWENQDPVDHTVTADDGAFDSALIGPNTTWSRTFDAAGTFPYHCAPHPFMKGIVVVRGS